MGGFIIGDENACNQCGRVEEADGSKIQWVCQGCGKLVCRSCTLTDPATSHAEYYHETWCSEDCRLVDRVEDQLKFGVVPVPVEDSGGYDNRRRRKVWGP